MRNKINNELNKFPIGMFDEKYDLKGKEFIKPLPSTYSIPIYKNGIKTEWIAKYGNKN